MLGAVAGNPYLHAQSEETPQTIVLTASDHRPSTSLNGDWHTIVDPYGNGLYDSHGKVRSDGYAKNMTSANLLPFMCRATGTRSANR